MTKDEIRRSSQLRTLLKRVVVNRTWKKTKTKNKKRYYVLSLRGVGCYDYLLIICILKWNKNSDNNRKMKSPFFNLNQIRPTADCELWWFNTFDSFSLFQPSDYLNHYNKYSYQLIVARIMRVRSMSTTLFFALAIHFVLKIESNVSGI